MTQEAIKTQKIALEPWEIGGELLDILSRGLYSDSKDAIREYVQNGIDAGAKKITITIDGPVVVIHDTGSGMNWESLRKARRFGLSDKSSRSNVGFRGIGIYAAFGMCETLIIRTRMAGTDKILHLKFQFGPMRRILEKDREAEKRQGIALANLLYEYTEFGEGPYGGAPEDQFTVVRLEGISQQYRSQLTDASALNSYLLNTVPVAYPARSYGSIVNQLLRDNVGLNPVNILLRVGTEPEIQVEPPLAEDVEEPQYYTIYNAQGRPTALIWHALTKLGERILSFDGADEGSGTSGFLLKLKGFTLGDRLNLKSLWPAIGGRTLYHHYTGEVHILSDALVYPNAARNDLEPGPAKQALFKDIQDYFDKLNRTADLTRDIIKTQKRLQGLDDTLRGLQERLLSLDTDPFELYRESKNLLEVLEKTEREMLRLIRGRKAIKPTTTQKSQLEQLTVKLKDAKGIVSNVAQRAERRTEAGRSRSPVGTSQQPSTPQAALLAKAMSALRGMAESLSEYDFTVFLQELSSAVETNMVARAVAVLDNLKATGKPLTDEVEASRKELRTFLGWSPVAPVSLAQGLDEEGFSPSSERERALIRAVDRGLLKGLGGRGERYETVLRAIVEEVSEELES